jgi:hypothetical protein
MAAALIRLLVFALLVCGPARAFAESFTQARCQNPEHHHEWRGPRRSDNRLRLAFRDADEHNRLHRGHSARVLLVERE